MIDWGVGAYEHTAEELLPVAGIAVRALGLEPGERVLDLGCGTGNAAKVAAAAGAAVVGVDPTERLLAVARDRVPEAEFLHGSAEAIPLNDDAVDAVVSVFAVIFCDAPEQAADEILRVLRPGGRAVVTTWRPEGGLHECFRVIGAALAELAPEPPPERFDWGEEAAVRHLFESRGATVTIEDAEISFTAGSPVAYVAEAEAHHPMMIGARAALEAAGRYEQVRVAAIDALAAHNTADDAGLRLASRYLVVTVRV